MLGVKNITLGDNMEEHKEIIELSRVLNADLQFQIHKLVLTLALKSYDKGMADAKKDADGWDLKDEFIKELTKD